MRTPGRAGEHRNAQRLRYQRVVRARRTGIGREPRERAIERVAEEIGAPTHDAIGASGARAIAACEELRRVVELLHERRLAAGRARSVPELAVLVVTPTPYGSVLLPRAHMRRPGRELDDVGETGDGLAPRPGLARNRSALREREREAAHRPVVDRGAAPIATERDARDVRLTHGLDPETAAEGALQEAGRGEGAQRVDRQREPRRVGEPRELRRRGVRAARDDPPTEHGAGREPGARLRVADADLDCVCGERHDARDPHERLVARDLPRVVLPPARDGSALQARACVMVSGRDVDGLCRAADREEAAEPSLARRSEILLAANGAVRHQHTDVVPTHGDATHVGRGHERDRLRVGGRAQRRLPWLAAGHAGEQHPRRREHDRSSSGGRERARAHEEGQRSRWREVRPAPRNRGMTAIFA